MFHIQLFNGTFLKAMEDGGVKLLKERLEKFFHRVSDVNFMDHCSPFGTAFRNYANKMLFLLLCKKDGHG